MGLVKILSLLIEPRHPTTSNYQTTTPQSIAAKDNASNVVRQDSLEECASTIRDQPTTNPPVKPMSKGGSEKELGGGTDVSLTGDLEHLGLAHTEDSEGADGSGSCTTFSSKMGDGTHSGVGDLSGDPKSQRGDVGLELGRGGVEGSGEGDLSSGDNTRGSGGKGLRVPGTSSPAAGVQPSTGMDWPGV